MYQAGVFHYILQMTRDRDLAADLTQETFVRALTSLARLRDPVAWPAWLFRIAHNQVRDRAAKATELFTGDEALLDQVDDRADPARVAVRADRDRALHAAIAALPADQRAVVVLHHLEGLDVAAVGAALGLRVGTVKSRLSRARAVLRRRLAPYVESN